MAQDTLAVGVADQEAQSARTGVPDSIERLRALALRRGNAGHAARLDDLLERFATQTFNLVVFGEFKRGKTTFINALIGDDLLPSAVVPLTSVVTLLHYAPQLSIRVEGLDGRMWEIGRDEVAQYVTERENPSNEKGVKVVRVGVPCDLLRNGMQLVDTPGVGSVYDHNTETAREFLPHVDGAILLVASDPPISRGECEFLLEMRPHVTRLFVVQNKIDQLRPEDVKESLDFTRSVLQKALGNGQVEVFPLSAREALEGKLSRDYERYARSGLIAFEEELRRFQRQEQAQTLAVSIIRGALQVAEQERLGLDLEQQALRMSVEEIERRYQEYTTRKNQVLRQRDDDITLIRAAARKLIQGTLERDYTEERKRQVPLLRSRLLEWAQARAEMAPGQLLHEASDFIKQTLFEVIGQWRQSEEKRLEQELSATLERFTARTNEALGIIYESARDVFDLPPRSVETIGYLAAPSRFLWHEWDWEPRLGLSGSVLVHLLPGARQRVIEASLTALLDEHDKACGRLRYDFAQRAQAAFDDYVRSLNRSLEEALSGIDRAITTVIAHKQKVTEDVSQAEKRVEQETAELESITAALRASLPTGVSHAS